MTLHRSLLLLLLPSSEIIKFFLPHLFDNLRRVFVLSCTCLFTEPYLAQGQIENETLVVTRALTVCEERFESWVVSWTVYHPQNPYTHSIYSLTYPVLDFED